jgi:hypothetical protein
MPDCSKMIAAMTTVTRNFLVLKKLKLCNQAPNSIEVVSGIFLRKKEAHWIIFHTNLASEQ